MVANLLEVILELSFRRLGALLIYDPKHEIHGHILNRESIVFSGWRTDVGVEAGTESGQTVIAPSLRDVVEPPFADAASCITFICVLGWGMWHIGSQLLQLALQVAAVWEGYPL